MTEIMEYLEIPQSPKAAPIPGARYAIDPVAFFFALICAPLLVAVLFCWIVAIPVFAIFFGGPFYLVFGTPVLLVYLHLRQGSPEGAAGLAMLTVTIGLIVIMLGMALTGETKALEGMFTFGLFAFVHAAGWGLAFGKLYNRWRSDISRQPLPPLFSNYERTIPC